MYLKFLCLIHTFNISQWKAIASSQVELQRAASDIMCTKMKHGRGRVCIYAYA